MAKAGRSSRAMRSLTRLTFVGFAVATAASSSAFASESIQPSGVDSSAPAPTSVSERLQSSPSGFGCSAGSWPFYEAECLWASDGSRPQAVRIIVVN